MIQMLGCLTLPQRSLKLSLFLLIFFFSPLCFIFPTILSFTLLILSSASVILLLVPSRVLLICYCTIHYWLLFFISFRSLLNISCIFIILVSSLFICNSILFSRFWIISTIIILNSFFQVDSLSPPFLFGYVGLYHVPLPAEYFSAFSFCLDCCVWGTLSGGWKFMVPLYCGACTL